MPNLNQTSYLSKQISNWSSFKFGAFPKDVYNTFFDETLRNNDAFFFAHTTLNTRASGATLAVINPLLHDAKHL